MEQRAKFRELRLAGTPREEAKTQAYGNVAPTMPVAPTWGATIAVAPQVNPQQDLQNLPPQPLAKAGDAVIGVGGERFVQANNYDGSTNVTWTPSVVNQSGGDVTKIQETQALATAKRYANNQANPPAPIVPISERVNTAPTVPTAPTSPVTPTNPITQNVAPTQPAPTTPKIPTSVTWADPWIQIPETPEFRASLARNQAMEDAKNGIYRTPEYYDSITKWTNPTPPPNADQMFSSIMMKAPVSDEQKVTTQYKVAQNRYLKASSYASMTPSQVSTDISSGKLIEWSQTYEDIKSMNPKLIQDTNNLRIVNGSKVNLYSTDSQGNKVNNVEQSFTEDYLGNFGTFLKSLFTVQTPEQIKSAIYTDDVKQSQDKATSIELEMNQIEADQAKMEEITRKELEWTWASAERIRLEIGIRQEKLQNQYNSKLKEYNTYANKANNLITQNTTVYQESMKQKSAQQQAIAGAAGQVFSQGLAQENERYKANLWLQTKQAEFEQWLEQQAQLASDPVSAVKATLKTFSDLWILADRSEAEIIADVQSKVASGIPLGQAISELQTAFKSKPMYKAMVDAQMASLQPKPTTPYELKELGGKTYKFNQATGQYEIISPIPAWSGGDLRYLADQFPWQAWAKNNNPAWITWNANFDKWTGTAKLFADAGIQFAKWTARPANEGGNYVTFATIEDGLKAQQIIMAQTYGNLSVGDMLAKWVGTSEWPNYAKQVAGMAWVDPSVKVSSLTPEQLSTLQMAKIKKESPWLYGILSQGTGTQVGKTFNDNDIALLWSVEKLDKQGKETLKDNGYSEADWAKFKAWLLPPTANQKTQANTVVQQIDDMLAWDSLSDAVGTAKTPWFITWTQRKDFEAKFASFRDNLALSNIDKLKWAMSDKDIEFLRNTASSLNLDMSEPEFIKQLNGIKQKYANIALWSPVNATNTTTPAPIFDKEALKARIKAKFQ